MEKLEQLRMKIQAQKCNCDSVQRRIEQAIPQQAVDDGAHMVCCVKCCYCHWDKIQSHVEEVIEWGQ